MEVGLQGLESPKTGNTSSEGGPKASCGPSHGCSGQLSIVLRSRSGQAKPSAGLRLRRSKKGIKVMVDILSLTAPRIKLVISWVLSAYFGAARREC
jgi:hypothetical protein